MIHRWRYDVAGGHTHVSVFCGAHDGALGKCGDLVYRNDEWEAVCPGLERIGVEVWPRHKSPAVRATPAAGSHSP